MENYWTGRLFNTKAISGPRTGLEIMALSVPLDPTQFRASYTSYLPEFLVDTVKQAFGAK